MLILENPFGSDGGYYTLIWCGETVDVIFGRIGVSRYHLHVWTSKTDQGSKSYSLSKIVVFPENPEFHQNPE